MERLGGAFGRLEEMNLIFARKTKGTGNQKANPRGTREAPRRHQGGTKEAASAARAPQGLPGGFFLPSDLFSKKKM